MGLREGSTAATAGRSLYRKPMKKKQLIDAFSTQAGTMAASGFFSNEEVLEKMLASAELRPHMRVLDLCCGTGIVARAIAPRVREVHAFDITPAMIAKARQLGRAKGLKNIRYRVGDAEATPYKKGFFDVVVTRLAFHHFEKPHRVVEETVRIVKPGGRVVVADIITDRREKVSELHNALEKLRDPSHVRMLKEAELLKLFRDGGFRLTGKEQWHTPREFGEWVAITDPDHRAPLFAVMKHLGLHGIDCGIDLAFTGGAITFRHTWLLFVGKK